MRKILRLLLFACMMVSTSSVFAQKDDYDQGKSEVPL